LQAKFNKLAVPEKLRIVFPVLVIFSD